MHNTSSRTFKGLQAVPALAVAVAFAVAAFTAFALIMAGQGAPAQAYAADLAAGGMQAQANDPVVVAPLVDHGDGTGADPDTDMNPADYAVASSFSPEKNLITLTATGLQKHYNADHVQAYWVGLGLPYAEGDTYATGFGEIPAKLEFEDAGVYEKGGVRYSTFYWGTLTSFAGKTGYVAVKDAEGAVTMYTVSFENTSCEHAITVDPTEHGKVTVPDSANDGDEVKLTATPDEEYELSELTVKDSKGGAVAVQDDTFTMPIRDVTVTATFAQKTYEVAVDKDIKHGTVESDKATAAKGETVKLTVTADEGYAIDTLTVKDADGKEVAVKDNAFAMPGSTVTVSATFKYVVVPTIQMHRLYNPNSGEHFYTNDEDEFKGLVALGWQSEGIGWTSPETSTTPVYRLYNPNAGDHHYTMDVSERDMLRAAGWNYEGIGWYSADEETGVPVYREYNPNEPSCNHNYTTDAYEHGYLVGLGWTNEGIAWYGM